MKTKFIFMLCMAVASSIGVRATDTLPMEYLEGTWESSDYRCTGFHTERIAIDMTDGLMDAVKLDAGGDRCVPTGSRTFSGRLPSEVAFAQIYKIVFTTGNTNAPACCKSEGFFKLRDTDSFVVCGNAQCTEEVMVFRRLFVGGGI